ncbi:MAG: hypothetical protein KGZ79_00400 [Dethiobacter sp.]|jgi:predicted transcriptional regulator|nr:hypothetical protein [Dethiobacter sp.]
MFDDPSRFYKTRLITKELPNLKQAPVNPEKYEKIAEGLEELSRKLVLAQYDLVELVKMTESPNHIETMKAKAHLIKHDGYYQINANIYPPKISVHPSQQKAHRHATTYQKVRDTWYSIIIEATAGHNVTPLDNAVVILRYRRKQKRFDPPNFNSKFILDALVHCGFISDDSRENIIVILAGTKSDIPGTDIYVGEASAISPVIRDLLKQQICQEGGLNIGESKLCDPVGLDPLI